MNLHPSPPTTLLPLLPPTMLLLLLPPTMHLNLMPLHLQNLHTMNLHLPQDTEHPKLDMVPLPNSNVQVVNLISPMVQITLTNMPPTILPTLLLDMVPPMPQ